MTVELLVLFLSTKKIRSGTYLQMRSTVRKLCISLSGVGFRITLKSSTVTEIDLSL